MDTSEFNNYQVIQGMDDEGSSSRSASPSSSSPPPNAQQRPRPKVKGIDESIINQYQEDDEEDIWPEEVEGYFQEALKIYPPIGRRKLLENGKMYGRNELIAKYIFQKTGKIRTRKQVSSHIQVLGKKTKTKPEPKQAAPPSQPRVRAPSSSSSSSSQAGSHAHSSRVQLEGQQAGFSRNTVPATAQAYAAYPAAVYGALQQPPYGAYAQPTNLQHLTQTDDFGYKTYASQPQAFPVLPQSPVSDSGYSSFMRALPVQMRHFYAYLEYASMPLSGMVNRHYYVSLNGSDFDDSAEEVQIDQVEGRYFGLRELFDKASLPCFFLAKCFVNANSQQNYGLHALFVKYESRQKMTLKCSTTVYSFGKAVVEKIQVEDPILEYNTYAYYFNHSPMCDYMVQFVEKLKGLNDISKMNRVLENFSCLQVIIDTQTNTTLMCTAFLFEVSDGGVMRNKVMRLVPSAK